MALLDEQTQGSQRQFDKVALWFLCSALLILTLSAFALASSIGAAPIAPVLYLVAAFLLAAAPQSLLLIYLGLVRRSAPQVPVGIASAATFVAAYAVTITAGQLSPEPLNEWLTLSLFLVALVPLYLALLMAFSSKVFFFTDFLLKQDVGY